jgi:hypothetical protein
MDSRLLFAALTKRFQGLEIQECPFSTVSESKSGRWGQGLTKEKMKDWSSQDLVETFSLGFMRCFKLIWA